MEGVGAWGRFTASFTRACSCSPGNAGITEWWRWERNGKMFSPTSSCIRRGTDRALNSRSPPGSKLFFLRRCSFTEARRSHPCSPSQKQHVILQVSAASLTVLTPPHMKNRSTHIILCGTPVTSLVLFGNLAQVSSQHDIFMITCEGRF